jgi:hypothetical protein
MRLLGVTPIQYSLEDVITKVFGVIPAFTVLNFYFDLFDFHDALLVLDGRVGETRTLDILLPKQVS